MVVCAKQGTHWSASSDRIHCLEPLFRQHTSQPASCCCPSKAQLELIIHSASSGRYPIAMMDDMAFICEWRHKSNVLTTDSCCWRCRSRAMAFVEIPIASSNNSLVCQYNPPLAFHRFPFTHARNRWENCMSHSQWSVTQNSNVRAIQHLIVQHLTWKKEVCNTKFALSMFQSSIETVTTNITLSI